MKSKNINYRNLAVAMLQRFSPSDSLSDVLPITVVINTLNRANSILPTLHALEKQTFQNFTLLIIEGPSRKPIPNEISLDSIELQIAYVAISEENLSLSRNVGISLAKSEFICFLDDDAIPEVNWLEQLIACITSDSSVALVGGWTIDHDGRSFQNRNIFSDLNGNSRNNSDSGPNNALEGKEFRTVLGTNFVLRTDAARSLGGFDVNYEYFLEETDLCIRAIIAGYKVLHCRTAVVYHKQSSGLRRSINKVPRDLTKTFRSYFYFKKKFSKYDLNISPTVLSHQYETMIRRLEQDINDMCRKFNSISESRRINFLEQLLSGYSNRNVVKKVKSKDYVPKNFTDSKNKSYRHKKIGVLLFIDKIPPNKYGGNGVWMIELAEFLVKQGFDVTVFTTANFNEVAPGVEYRNGIWVHYLDIGSSFNNFVHPEMSLDDFDQVNLLGALKISNLYYNELNRVRLFRNIDCLIATNWDFEGLISSFQSHIPVLTFNVTSNSQMYSQSRKMDETHLELLLRLEELVKKTSNTYAFSSKSLMEKDSHVDYPSEKINLYFGV
jgi:glycogen(starch) synthase